MDLSVDILLALLTNKAAIKDSYKVAILISLFAVKSHLRRWHRS